MFAYDSKKPNYEKIKMKRQMQAEEFKKFRKNVAANHGTDGIATSGARDVLGVGFTCGFGLCKSPILVFLKGGLFSFAPSSSTACERTLRDCLINPYNNKYIDASIDSRRLVWLGKDKGKQAIPCYKEGSYSVDSQGVRVSEGVFGIGSDQITTSSNVSMMDYYESIGMQLLYALNGTDIFEETKIGDGWWEKLVSSIGTFTNWLQDVHLAAAVIGVVQIFKQGEMKNYSPYITQYYKEGNFQEIGDDVAINCLCMTAPSVSAELNSVFGASFMWPSEEGWTLLTTAGLSGSNQKRGGLRTMIFRAIAKNPNRQSILTQIMTYAEAATSHAFDKGRIEALIDYVNDYVRKFIYEDVLAEVATQIAAQCVYNPDQSSLKLGILDELHGVFPLFQE